MGKMSQKYRCALCAVVETCVSALNLLRDSMNLRRGRPGCFWTRTGPAASPGQHGGRGRVVTYVVVIIITRKSRQESSAKAAHLWPRSMASGFRWSTTS